MLICHEDVRYQDKAFLVVVVALVIVVIVVIVVLLAVEVLLLLLLVVVVVPAQATACFHRQSMRPCRSRAPLSLDTSLLSIVILVLLV